MQPWNLGAHQVALPIVQGGMGVGISLAKLASAVANEGGVGVISAVGLGWDTAAPGSDLKLLQREALRAEIIKAKELAPHGIVGVNIMMALSDAEDLMLTSARAGANALFLGAGLPLAISKAILEYGTQVALVPIVSSGRAARLIRDTWLKKYQRQPDAFVVEGPLAGGHLGFKRTEIAEPEHSLSKILDQVLTVAREGDSAIPVIAAGGIFSANDVRSALVQGATAVQLGTRFVATWECDASTKFKEAYIGSQAQDIEIVESPVGLPGRAIHSPFLEALAQGKRPTVNCRFRCLRNCNPATTPYCIARALMAARQGDFANGFAFCGANAHRISEIVPVKALMQELVSEIH